MITDDPGEFLRLFGECNQRADAAPSRFVGTLRRAGTRVAFATALHLSRGGLFLGRTRRTQCLDRLSSRRGSLGRPTATADR